MVDRLTFNLLSDRHSDRGPGTGEYATSLRESDCRVGFSHDREHRHGDQGKCGKQQQSC